MKQKTAKRRHKWLKRKNRIAIAIAIKSIQWYENILIR